MNARIAVALVSIFVAVPAAAAPAQPHAASLERCIRGSMDACEDLFAPWDADAALEEGCDGEVPSACAELGSRYIEADGHVAPRALAAFSKGCDKGFGPACHMAATFAGDPARAAPLLTRACSLGFQLSCAALGNLHDAGEGVEHSMARARALYQEACSKGLLLACSNLQRTWTGPDATKGEAARARAELGRLCDRGDGSACLTVAEWHQVQAPAPIESFFTETEDQAVARWLRSKASRLYAKACHLGEAEGCQINADLGPAAYRDSLYDLGQHERACAQGKAGDCLAAARLYRGSEVIAPNWRRAARLAEKGCLEGLAEACEELGALRVQHALRPQQERRAVLSWACDRGTLPACARLGTWFAAGTWGPREPATALELLARACTDDEGAGCAEAARLWKAGGKQIEAREALARGCRSTRPDLCTRAAAAFPKAEEQRAHALLRSGCAADDVASCNQLRRKALPVGIVRNHRQVADLRIGGMAPAFVAFDPSGGHLLLQGGENDRQVEWRAVGSWAIERQSELPRGSDLFRAAWFEGSEPAALLVVANLPHLWRPADGALPLAVAGEEVASCYRGAFDAGTGRLFVYCVKRTPGGVILLFDAASRKQIGPPVPLDDTASDLRVRADGTLAVATEGGWVTLDPAAGGLEHDAAFGKQVPAFAVPVEGGDLAVVNQPFREIVVRIRRGETWSRSWSREKDVAETVEADPTGRYVAIGTRDGLALFFAADGKPAHPLLPLGPIRSLAFSPDGTTLAAVGNEVHWIELQPR